MSDYNAFVSRPAADPRPLPTGPLSGLSLAVKDLFDVEGLVTGCGNPDKAAENPPATETAPAVRALLSAGARFVGKTQTEELAFSVIGQNVHFPWPVNPAAPDRVTGGSSSGSAAAVAGGLAGIATASDTNGSVRIPACFCGLIGLRTTHGRIPLDGAMPLARSLDTFGWFARDAAIYERVGDVLLDAFPGPETPADALRRPLRSPLLEALLSGPDEAGEYRHMAALTADVLGPPAEMSDPPSAVDTLYDCILKLQAREAWDVHGEWVSRPGRRIAEAIRDRFLFGASLADADLGPEKDRRAHFRAWLGGVLGDDGVLVMPTSPSAAPRSDSDPDTLLAFRQRAIRMLCWSGLSGFPQITLPLGKVGGAPFGISLLGPAGSDRALIRLGRRILDAGAARVAA